MSENGELRILGVQLASCNSPRTWIRQLRQQWSPLLHAIRRMSNKYGGARQEACQTLARAVAVGKPLFGFTVYVLSKKHIEDVELLHRATLCTITGLLKRTRIDRLTELVTLSPIRATYADAQQALTDTLECTVQGRSILAWGQLSHTDNRAPSLRFPWDSPVI